MQPTEAAFSESRMQIGIKAITLVSSVAACWYFLTEAQVEMTPERYARFCGDVPECYPEWLFVIAAFLSAVIGAFAAVCLIVDALRFVWSILFRSAVKIWRPKSEVEHSPSN